MNVVMDKPKINKTKTRKWLCPIPAHWDIRRNGRLFRELKLKGSEDLPILTVSIHDGVTVRDMSDKNHRQMMQDKTKYQRLEKGDIAYNMMRMWQGAVGVAPVDGLVSPAYVCARPFPEVNAKYYEYLFRTPIYKGEVEGYSRGIVSDRNRLYWEGFKQVPTPFPPKPEQDSIVAFLDRELEEIDRFVSAKHKLISLLNEEIGTAIDQRLRGSEGKARPVTDHIWCPSVHEDYPIERLKFAIGYQEGPGIMASDFHETGIPLLRIASVKGEEASLEGCNFLDPQKVAIKWNHFRVRKGDYLISASASFGTMCLVTEVAEGSIPYTGIIRVWPKHKDVLMPYVKLFMRSKMFLEQIDLLKSGSAMQHYGPSHLGRMFIVLPQPSEQKRIVEDMAKITLRVETKLARIHKEIELINEFRTSLITEAVMGKIEI